MSTVVTRDVPSCASLVPEDWKEGVAGTPLPPDDQRESLRSAFIMQTGRLAMANGRTRDAISIVEQCEARDRKATRKRFLGIF